MWNDSIFIYLIGLGPAWYCDTDFTHIRCTPEASSTAMFAYVAVLVPLTGLLKHVVEWPFENFPERAAPRGLHLLQEVINYFVGWAAGSAMVRLLQERQEASGCAESADGCAAIGVVFATASTALGGMFIGLIKPYADRIECCEQEDTPRPSLVQKRKRCGPRCLVQWLEDLLEDVLAMASRAASVVAMSVWGEVLPALIFPGVDASARLRVTVFWAGTAMYTGAHLSVQLERIELWVAPRRRSKVGRVRQSRAEEVKQLPAMTRSYIELSGHVQAVLAFVAGSACNGVFSSLFPSLSADPSLGTIASNVAIAAVVTLLCTAWLVITKESGELGEDEGDCTVEVEKYYVTNAMGFFVGGVLLVVAKNVITFVGVLADGVLDNAGQDRLGVGERVVLLVCVVLFSILAYLVAYFAVDLYTPQKGSEWGVQRSLMFHPSRRNLLTQSHRNLIAAAPASCVTPGNSVAESENERPLLASGAETIGAPP